MLVYKFYEMIAYRCMQECKMMGHMAMTRLVVDLGYV